MLGTQLVGQVGPVVHTEHCNQRLQPAAEFVG